MSICSLRSRSLISTKTVEVVVKPPIVRMQPQRHKRVMNGHPWVYSNEIVMDSAAKAIVPGTIVEFRAHDQRYLGTGSFNSHSLIAGRIFTREIGKSIDGAWLYARLEEALSFRQKIIADPYYRLVHAEADQLPGLIVDRFGSHLCVQLNTAGMNQLWPHLEEALVRLLQPQVIILRNDSSSRALEGLEREVKVAYGSLSGLSEVRENNLTYFADLASGQKTGWYFDQRDNHALVARFCHDAAVLDLYCHAGGFGLLAARAGAKSVVGVDSSEAALALAQKAALHNKLGGLCRFERADIFEDLERRMTGNEKFDVVIADPPAFVKSRKDAAAGARGYRKLTRLCAQVISPGGMLFIASCSYNMELSVFTEQLALGLHEANRRGRILYTVFAAPDHPTHPQLPESAYLKGLLVRID